MKEKNTSIIDFKTFYNDAVEYSILVHQKFTLHNAILFFIYGMGLGNINIENKVVSCILCYSVFVISLAVYIFSQKYVLQHKKCAFIVYNLYLFVFLLLLRFLFFFHSSQISYTLLICSMVTTAMTNMYPKFYGFILLSISVIHMIIHFVLLNHTDAVEIVENVLNDFLIIIFTLGINRLFVKMKYNEFKQKKFLQNESYRDPLTNMYNRRYVEHYVELNMEKDVAWAVLLMDLDNFKNVNDVLGHEIGDDLLRKVSANLKSYFRKTDCVARIGGDEFLITLLDITNRKAIVEKVSSVLQDFPICLESADKKQSISVSASIGIAFGKVEEIHDFEKLYRRADEYMYEAKNQGKGVAVTGDLQGKEIIIIQSKSAERKNNEK